MSRTFLRPVPALVYTLAAGTAALAAVPPNLPASQLSALKAQQPARVSTAQAELTRLAPQLGLSAATGFLPRQVTLNPQGRTTVRFHQTHGGLRVWAGEAIAQVEADGQVQVLTKGLKTVSLPDTTPRLSAEQAKAIALRNLAPKGPMTQTPKVEEVVFPARFTGGMATRIDAAKKQEVWDREMSLWAKPPASDFVRAYEVRTLLTNKQDGHREICFIVDADTGTILRKWDAVQGDAPAAGTGASYFRGNVPLGTSKAEDGTYSLVSQERGTLPNPYVLEQGVNWTGLTTCHAAVDLNVGMLGFDTYKGLNTSNQWGTGSLMPFPYDFSYVPDPMDWSHWWGGMLLDFSQDGMAAWSQGALSPAGETTAVDAHYGLSATWDFYKNVFNRDGIDDHGTSTFAVVHQIDATWDGIYPMYDNAFWAPWYFGMVFGEGSYGTPWANGGYGMRATTEIDITGHELSHGVTEYSANLIYKGQSGGMNEGSSDIFGKMVQAYVDGGSSGASIPDFPAGDLTKWEVGRNSAADPTAPLRFMYHPSLDGSSADGWFDGIDFIDVHYSSGPLNRCFYFLACGASSTPSSTTYSPYYPAGMAGLGNDKAARIWYKALTEHLLPDSDFEAARAATVTAAQELHGIGSPEELAVMKAWSAVNVGLAPGQAPRVRVSFPIVNGEGSWLDANAQPEGILKRVQIFPTRTNVQVSCNVENTTNKALTFSTPKWLGYAPAGTIKADGTWTTPNWNYYEDLLSIKATSQADPSQFAWTWTLLVELDADADTEIDAVDLGSTAMSWYKTGAYFETPNTHARLAGGGDWDVVFFTQAFANAFTVK
ncbi:MAG: M4 family metallopeptidase [Holophagaceae bacterium]